MKTHSTYSQMTLERFRPRRNRGWKRRLGCWLWVIVAAIVLALVGAARAEAGSFAPQRGDNRRDEVLKEGPPAVILAGFGASDAVAVGIVLCVIVGLLARLWWRSVAEREEASTYADEGWDPYAGDKPVSVEVVDPLAVGGNEIPPSEEMPEGLTRLDAALIVHACASRVGLIRSIVQGAQRPITEEDQAEALATAERLLGDLRVTLCELRARFKPEEGMGLTGEVVS